MVLSNSDASMMVGATKKILYLRNRTISPFLSSLIESLLLLLEREALENMQTFQEKQNVLENYAAVPRRKNR